MGIAAWLVWQQEGFKVAAMPLSLFAAQLVLNVAWSWIFFGLHQPGWAFVEIVMLWLAILATTVAFFRRSRSPAWLLVPYLGMGELCQRAQLHDLADEHGLTASTWMRFPLTTKPAMRSWRSTSEPAFARVTIEPDWDDGPARHADIQVEWPLDRFTERELHEKSVQVALAGPVAEMIHSGEPYHPGFVAEWAADWKAAWEAAATTHSSGTQTAGLSGAGYW